MNFWLKQKFSYYLIMLVLRWKIAHLILAKQLLFSRNNFFCFQKWKFLGASTQVEFTNFYNFFSEDLHMCSPQRDRQKCAEKFSLFFNWKILKKIEKGLVSIWFKKPGFPILHYNHRIKQNKKSFCTHFCRHCQHYKENTCSKFQRKMIIAIWQISKKLISKNNNTNSKDNNINMN